MPCRRKPTAASHKSSAHFAQKVRPSATAFASYAATVRTIRLGSSPPPRQPFQPSAKTTQSTHENHPAKAALQNGPFRVAIRPISQAKTAHFALRNGPFCNVLIISVLHTRIYFFLMTLSTCEAKLLIPFTDGCPLFLSMSLRRITGTP